MKKIEVKHKVSLSSNLIDVEVYIKKYIKKYDVLIQENELISTKKIMANINKEKKDFSDKCKLILEEVLKPVNDFKIIQIRIEQLFVDSRLQLKSQVDKFEETYLVDIKNTLEQYRDNECKSKGVNKDLLPIDTYIMLSAVTKTGTLTLKVKSELDVAINGLVQYTLNQKRRDKLISEYPHHKSSHKKLLKLLKKLNCDENETI